MDSVQMDEAEKKLEEASDAELLLSDASEPNGVFDTPLVGPEVGDEYQAEIPPMLTHTQLLHLSTNPIESESTENSFLMGLPMPITWICNEVKTSNVDRSSYFPVPGLSPESWSEFEVECFVLGLYIFGKNLVLVQRFMDTKDVGQIQLYYYGKFYKSPRYCKWVDCRKMRTKKRVMGSKIFTGCRQHELLARLLPHLSGEAKNTFHEISSALVEERMSLEEYVSSLKRMVGICFLVEAIGIGNGKEDLTTLITENSKSGQRQRGVRLPELPSGKACSSLTSADIIKFLTSDIRLSKARSNDLFWEAVWPRLLAKGWHSEQPNDICTAPKNNLVFLMPGVKKFSRRKLMNGTHYFDSVSDVLRKVASEPRILDLEVEEARTENSKEESHDCALDDKDRPCYLKPQGVTNVMKFTVIDTSLPSKVRELRSLPPEEKHSNGHKPIKPNVVEVRAMKHDVTKGVKTVGLHHSGRAIKRQRVKQEKPSFVLSLPASTTDKNFMIRECCPKGKKPQSPAKISLRESKPHLLLIDLNLPHVPMDHDEEQFKMEDLESVALKTEPMGSFTSCEEASSSRRHSTRTRPLTTKALEALEIGFLSLRQNRKRSSVESMDRKTKVNRQGRSDDEGSYGEPNGVGDVKMDVVANETAWPVNC
ncbi:hypothetical protein V2J09_007879 [Rumex salicifolius]